MQRLLSCWLLMLIIGGNRLDAAAPANSSDADSPTLEELCSGKLKIVDLTWPINEKNAFWPGDNYKPFELRTIATLEKDGVLSKAFSMPEHLGTHIDAPNHFESNQPAVDKIAPEDLFAPGVLIDCSGPAASDADFTLAAEHVLAWEKDNGRIPDGAVVLLHTGWSRHWNNVVRYQNADTRGRLHFPSFSAEAAKLLVEERKAKGLGLDTLSIDAGQSRDFPVHHIVNAAGRYGLENLANLDKLPARGFYLVIAPIKIETGSGGPTRVFAILP